MSVKGGGAKGLKGNVRSFFWTAPVSFMFPSVLGISLFNVSILLNPSNPIKGKSDMFNFSHSLFKDMGGGGYAFSMNIILAVLENRQKKKEIYLLYSLFFR